MRGLIESKLLWLCMATVVAYTCGWIGLLAVAFQLFVLLCAALPLQRVTMIGMVFLFLFTVALGITDALCGSLNLFQVACWFIVGACYVSLFEYVALYELSAAMRDYGFPSKVIVILNFGIRFIPIAVEGTREAFVGAKARGGLSLGSTSTLGAISTAVFVRLLHKFEDMWISYNIRKARTRRFQIGLELSDYLFILFSVSLFGLVIWNYRQSVGAYLGH